MVDNYRQQAPSSLTFASPLAKLDSVNFDQELFQCFRTSKVHMRSKKILLQIRLNWSDFQSYPYYL
jgi:hypothetical protein